MRSLLIVLCAALILVTAIGACKKPKQNNDTGTLTIQTNPAAGSNLAPAPGPDFPLVVTITAGMPSAGVKIDVTARAEGSTAHYFTASLNTSNAVNNFVITGAPQGLTSVVDVTVTDLSNASVKTTATYRFSKK